MGFAEPVRSPRHRGGAHQERRVGYGCGRKGIRRTDPLESLLGLRFGVRVDHPGQLVRDFHTAQRPEKQRDGAVSWTALPLSYRYYVSDAVFPAVLEGEPELLAGIDDAVRKPEFPGEAAAAAAAPIRGTT
jgi:CRISPR system Cascade subunit CasD